MLEHLSKSLLYLKKKNISYKKKNSKKVQKLIEASFSGDY